MKNLKHPGIVLEENFIKPMNLTYSQFAKKVGLSPETVRKVVRGKRKITTRTAKKLSNCLDTDPAYWLELQNNFDLKRTTIKTKKNVKHNNCIIPISEIKFITHNDEDEIDVHTVGGEVVSLTFHSRKCMKSVLFSYIGLLTTEGKMFLSNKQKSQA